MSGPIGIGIFFVDVFDTVTHVLTLPAVSGALLLFFVCVFLVWLCLFLQAQFGIRHKLMAADIFGKLGLMFFVLSIVLPIGFMAWRFNYGT